MKPFLSFADVQISDATHGHSGQIGDECASCADDGSRKRAGSSKCARGRVALKQIERRRMVKARSENRLERRMGLSKQAANAVAGLRDLSGEVVIEASQHGELGQSK